MERVAIGAAVGAVFCFVTAAVAQDIEVSSLDIKQSAVSIETKRPVKAQAGYIVDVSGRQVRLVGPRFFPDNSKEVALFGRADALVREEARSQMASN
ncbi:hypothetical protein HRR99_17745 [Agrobacterium vaccinii]|jgi:hypothetical protein|uniref:hypothetical protein n=1 Tax=Agrobacterium TaxID=357 RepID=UPI001E5BD530|nr:MULTISPECIES: hypothetical protein [Agrobacterium]UHS59240.1 hypothetical protein HRS00_20680 [Agrobacterium vaccinii]UHS63422.1 hypothetical protein HRR99_17745 [Agrobacterium vaccinii]